MEALEENPALRPNEEEFKKKVGAVRLTRGTSPEKYGNYISEISLFAKGEGDPVIRERWYPGWENEDFEILWKKLEQEDLI